MEHTGLLDAGNGSAEGHLPAVFRNEGDHEKIFRGPLAAITLTLGTADRTMEFAAGGDHSRLEASQSYGNTLRFISGK